MNLPVIATGGRLAPIVPQTMDEVWRVANAVVRAGMAPKSLVVKTSDSWGASIDPERTTSACAVAIMHGLEIGLTPLAALQRIAVINGMPTLWGDGAIGLVRGSGLCEYVKERIEGEGDLRVAICETKRRSEAEPTIRRFSVEDAKRAGLWKTSPTTRKTKKNGETYEVDSGPWYSFPERMLQMRARAFALRDAFADVLGGMYLREEIEDAPAKAAPAREPVEAVEAEVVEVATQAIAGPAEPHLLDRLETACAAAETKEALDEAVAGFREGVTSLPAGEQREARLIKARHAKRLAGPVAVEAAAETAEPAQTTADAEAAAYQADPRLWLKQIDEAFAEKADLGELNEAFRRLVDPFKDVILPPDWEICESHYATHRQRIEEAA